ncbi:hypothetical protein ARTSIC4J27_3820 [Pseudarthrobacter siccitolerans]|uniref:Uncharacterized protein n=1 Tax=Pseudarthrobacter siccitolerans TaxID=861266 RepID=A0A024H7R9_9MICC|nr:hypothetical protein ARTSIC4J27_3820 [Pseudarthrobacter siccitolerans]
MRPWKGVPETDEAVTGLTSFGHGWNPMLNRSSTECGHFVGRMEL